MRTIRILSVAGAVLSAFAATTPTAQAGELSVGEYGKGGDIGLTYVAFPGESNAIRASFDRTTGAFVLTDDGALLMEADPESDMADSCTFEQRRVTCPLPADDGGPCCGRYVELRAILSDGDDSATVVGDFSAWWIEGGPGSDTLGGLANTSFLGSGRLDGNAGDDTLRGGPGSQQLDGGTGADLIDGGEGTDQVSWGQTMAGFELPFLAGAGMVVQDPPQAGGVHVRLDGYRNDGHLRGEEGDNVINVENVLGTPFADLIVGSAGNNRLEGLEGNDRITGGAGRDEVWGGWDHDWIDLRDGEADHFLCDAGVDQALVDPVDAHQPGWAGHGCEKVG